MRIASFRPDGALRVRPALALCALVVLCGGAVAAPAAPGGDIELNFRDAPLSEVVETIARATGEPFLFDDSLTGRVSITVAQPVEPEEALSILDAALLMQGFVALHAGTGFRKIMPIEDAQSGAPIARPDPDRAATVTTFIRLDLAPADDVAAKLQHLVAQNDSLIAYPPTNSLILVGSENRLRRLIELARVLDVQRPSDLLIRTLRHRDASSIADLLRELAEPKPGLEPLQVWADARTNSVLALGPVQELARAARLLADFDRPPQTSGRMRVVRVLHRDATEIADMLGSLTRSGAPELRGGVFGDTLVGRSFNAVADPQTNSLVVDADAETFAILEELVGNLDRIRPTILVEVIAYEVSNPSALSLGLDWFLPAVGQDRSGNTLVTMTSNPSGGGLRSEAGPDVSFLGRASRSPLILPFVDGSGQPVQAVLPRETLVVTADSRQVETRVLMRPRLLMTSGTAQEIFVGQNIPVPVGETGEGAATNPNQTRSVIERRDVGVTLRIEPKIGQAGKVSLDLDLTLARLAAPIAGPVDLVGPSFEQRDVSSKLLLSSGELAVIGVSHERKLQERERGTPFLRDIPILGHLMRSSSTSSVDTHLIFAVQARILRTPSENLAESIRERLAMERNLSRLRGLERVPGAPYAVLVDTRSDPDDARAVAEEIRFDGAVAQIGVWEHTNGPRYDVYLTDYSELSAAGADALRLRKRGFETRVVVLPDETALASALPFSSFPSVSGRLPAR